MFDKLYRRITGKIRENEEKICRTEKYLMDDAEIALIAYGSEVRPAKEAACMLRDRGIKAGVLRLCNVWPVPEKAIREVAENVGRVFAVEMNVGKYSREIERACAGRCPVAAVTKNCGQIHTPTEIYTSVMAALA